MDNYTFEQIPNLLGKMVGLLEEINKKLDKIASVQITTDSADEWMTVNDLTLYMPTHPATPTIYGWIRNDLIPYYKKGKRLMFKRNEIEEWMSRTQVKDADQLEREAQEYVAMHPLGTRSSRR